jgi:hypothetical protein
LSPLIILRTFCASALVTLAGVSFWACEHIGAAAITNMATINLRFTNIYSVIPPAMMMSNPKKVTK